MVFPSYRFHYMATVLFFLFLCYCQLVSKCSPVLPNIITPLFIYPAPLYTFAIFQCQLWTFEEFLLDVLLDLTARAIFPVLLHPLSFFPFHFFTGVTAIVNCLILQGFFFIWPSNQLSNLAKAGQARKCEIVLSYKPIHFNIERFIICLNVINSLILSGSFHMC